MIYGTSADTPPGSMSHHLAEALLATQAAELADNRPVTLKVTSVGLFTRLVLLRPALREVTRRLKLRRYVPSKRDRYSWTFTYE